MRLEHLERSYCSVGPCPGDALCRGSLRELCGSAAVHGECAAIVVAHNMDAAPWPAAGAKP
eukprot:3900644-Pyramimonas_sp.AAC.1